jgi:hypothetical protein
VSLLRATCCVLRAACYVLRVASRHHTQTHIATVNMEGPSSLYERSRKHHGPGAPRPAIAATFEECVKQLRQIHLICRNLSKVVPGEDVDLVAETLARLLAWGDETGASKQILDRKLRLDSALKEKITWQLSAAMKKLVDGTDGAWHRT